METLYNILSYGGLALAVIFAIVAVILFIKLHIPKAIGDLTGATARKQIEEIREKGYEGVQGGGISKKDAIKDKSSTGRISVRDVKSAETTPTVKPSKAVQERSHARYKQAIEDLQSSKTVSYTNNDNPEGATDILGAEEDFEGATDVLGAEEDFEGATDVLGAEEDFEGATDVLNTEEDFEGATDVLSGGYDEEATDVLNTEEDFEGATDVLSGGYDEEATDVLNTEEDFEGATDILNGAYTDNTEIEDDLLFAPGSGFTKIYDVIVVNTNESIRREKK